MKDKRLDALLETLPTLWLMNNLTCHFYYFCCENHFTCNMPSAMYYNSSVEETYPHTQCQGDIRKCEREE